MSSKRNEEHTDSRVSETTFVQSTTQEQEQVLVREVEQNETSSENIMEEVRVVESSDVKHESTEEQLMSNSVSESDLLLTKTRENIQTAETSADEVVETQLIAEAEEESTSSNQHQEEKMTNEDIVESNGNEEKSTNEAETNDMPTTNLQNTERTQEQTVVHEVQQNEVSNESIAVAQEVCVTESSDVNENTGSSSKTTSHKQKEKKLSHVNITRKSASDEQEDPLITKLDKRIDKELRIIQGNNEDEEDSGDIDDDTLNDLLYGQRAKELNEFLKA